MRRLDTCYRNIRCFEFDFDYPNVGSKGSLQLDIATVASFPLGTHILFWGFGSDASAIEDLQISFQFVAVDTLRLVMVNPSAGAINAGVISTQMITGEYNTECVDVQGATI